MCDRTFYYKKEILDAINFADMNIKEDISWFDAAKSAWHSEFHFHRIFANCTGVTLSEYIRRRRLSLAAEEMCRKNRRIIDIAYEFRFSHEQSFIRAFRHEFGVSPGKFRKQKISLTLFPRIKSINKENPDCQLVLNHGFILAGKKHVVNYEENNLNSVCSILTKEFITKYMPGFDIKQEAILFGYDEKIIGDTNNFYSMPSILLKENAKVPPGIELQKIPFHVSYRTKWHFNRPVSEIPNPDVEKIYVDLYNDIIPSSGYSLPEKYDYASSSLFRSGGINCFTISIPVLEK